MYSGYRTRTDLFWGTVLGVAASIAFFLLGMYEMPNLKDPTPIQGVAETVKVGEKEWPTLIAHNGHKYNCKLRDCSISANPNWRGAAASGYASSDGILIELRVDDRFIVSRQKFEDNIASQKVCLAIAVVVEVILLLFWMFKKGFKNGN